MRLEGLRDSYFTSLFAAPYLGRLTNFASCVFCSGLSLEDFYKVTELSRYSIGVAFFKTLISRSNEFLWLERTVCYSQLNLTSDRLLSHQMWFLCRFRHIRYVESGSFRNLKEFFQPLMFLFVTIKDLKYYLQRDELISLLMFVTPGPAYLYNSAAGCCFASQSVISYKMAWEARKTPTSRFCTLPLTYLGL